MNQSVTIDRILTSHCAVVHNLDDRTRTWSLCFHTADFLYHRKHMLSVSTTPTRNDDVLYDIDNGKYLQSGTLHRVRRSNIQFDSTSGQLTGFDLSYYSDTYYNTTAIQEVFPPNIERTNTLLQLHTPSNEVLGYTFERHNIEFQSPPMYDAATTMTLYLDRIIKPIEYELITLKVSLRSIDNQENTTVKAPLTSTEHANIKAVLISVFKCLEVTDDSMLKCVLP